MSLTSSDSDSESCIVLYSLFYSTPVLKMSSDKSVEMLNIGWNEKRFHESKSMRRAARQSIFRAKLGKLVMNMHFY